MRQALISCQNLFQETGLDVYIIFFSHARQSRHTIRSLLALSINQLYTLASYKLYCASTGTFEECKADNSIFDTSVSRINCSCYEAPTFPFWHKLLVKPLNYF